MMKPEVDYERFSSSRRSGRPEQGSLVTGHGIPKTQKRCKQRSNKKRYNADKNEDVNELLQEPYTCKRSHKAENTKCLSKALRKHAVALVDCMYFKETSIPEELIAEGCLTEDECKSAREKTERKDQVRKVLGLIKGRNFNILKKFLDIVGKREHYPNIVENIWKTYEELLHERREYQCGFCAVKQNVDVKFVMDYLWQEGAISDALYRNLSDTDEPREDYWDSIIESCYSRNKMDALFIALNSNEYYSHIAMALRSEFKRNKSFHVTKCFCSLQSNRPILSDTLENFKSATSHSPNSTPSNSRSSLSTSSTETLNSNVEIVEGMTECAARNDIHTSFNKSSRSMSLTLQGHMGYADDAGEPWLSNGGNGQERHWRSVLRDCFHCCVSGEAYDES